MRPQLVEDPFTCIEDDQDTPRGDVIVSLARFEAEGEWLLGSARQRRRAAGRRRRPEQLAYGALPRLPVVALAFPKFRDGRAYSSAAAAARALPVRGRGARRGRRAARAGALHGPLRLRRLRARGRIDSPKPGPRAAHGFRHVYQRAADDRAPAFAERMERA